MNEKRIIASCDNFEYTLEESKEVNLAGKEKEKFFLKGILQKSDALNQNGRIYPRSILAREVRNYQKFIIENRALGECDHPDSSTVSLQDASHIVREARMENDGSVFGRIEVLSTPKGKIIKKLVEAGVKIGISSRGVGSVQREGDYYVVQDDFQLICWDLVADPSTPQAFMLPEGRLIESNERKNLNSYFNKSDRIDRILNEILELNK